MVWYLPRWGSGERGLGSVCYEPSALPRWALGLGLGLRVFGARAHRHRGEQGLGLEGGRGVNPWGFGSGVYLLSTSSPETFTFLYGILI